MLCKEAIRRDRMGGSIGLILEDEEGSVRASFGVTYTGMVTRAFGLEINDDITLAVGREVSAFFNFNGIVTRLTRIES